MKLPPLTAVRHFNAAATHLSFKLAAAELCVSEGAISRQIKLLEEYLGCALFVRGYRGVDLTEAGRRFYAATDSALLQIAQSATELREAVPQFTLSVTTSYAIRWLMPRLARYEAEHPNHPVNLQTVTYPEKLPGRLFDASIIYRLGDPHDAGTVAPENSELVMIEWLLPVCAPGFLPGGKPLDAGALARQRILFNEPTGRDWRSWLGKITEQLPNAQIDLERALRFEHDDTAIQAAVAGHGIALANLAYINTELALGSLVPAVACDPLPIGGHYIISAGGKAALPQVRAFRDWLLKTAAECPSQCPSQQGRMTHYRKLNRE
ncbi:LysR substrate-binding domain-containing protein [Kiloniella laminariae]|uniref:LysR substrate-binding domain-containing protein n=1 Tax=Kiloniella laminariae TaxID=454162 RepID=A0ABT4LFJ0_9PROT|nr:LysR substrate-binding domain-containing protein [Kiloniella laminariae]MCZ4279881.1 LysR substrate-binding domain-containing protein [Kiloniella laminariae]